MTTKSKSKKQSHDAVPQIEANPTPEETPVPGRLPRPIGLLLADIQGLSYAYSGTTDPTYLLDILLVIATEMSVHPDKAAFDRWLTDHAVLSFENKAFAERIFAAVRGL